MLHSPEPGTVMVSGFFVVWGHAPFLTLTDRMKSRGTGAPNGEFS